MQIEPKYEVCDSVYTKSGETIYCCKVKDNYTDFSKQEDHVSYTLTCLNLTFNKVLEKYVFATKEELLASL